MSWKWGETTRAGERVSLSSVVGIGLATGLLSGLMGVGGGVIAIPLLMGMLAFGQRRASGTSLAIVAPTAMVSAVAYALNGQVDWLLAVFLAIGTTTGAIIGARLTNKIPVRTLRLMFAALLLLVGVRMVVG